MLNIYGDLLFSFCRLTEGSSSWGALCAPYALPARCVLAGHEFRLLISVALGHLALVQAVASALWNLKTLLGLLLVCVLVLVLCLLVFLLKISEKVVILRGKLLFVSYGRGHHVLPVGSYPVNQNPLFIVLEDVYLGARCFFGKSLGMSAL